MINDPCAPHPFHVSHKGRHHAHSRFHAGHHRAHVAAANSGGCPGAIAVKPVLPVPLANGSAPAKAAIILAGAGAGVLGPLGIGAATWLARDIGWTIFWYTGGFPRKMPRHWHHSHPVVISEPSSMALIAVACLALFTLHCARRGHAAAKPS